MARADDRDHSGERCLECLLRSCPRRPVAPRWGILPEEPAVVRERLKALQATAAPLVRADQGEFLCGLRDGVEHAVDLNPGVRLPMGIKAVSEPDERGM